MTDRALGYMVSMVITFIDEPCGALPADATSLLRNGMVLRGLTESGQTHDAVMSLSLFGDLRQQINKDDRLIYNRHWEDGNWGAPLADLDRCPVLGSQLSVQASSLPLLRVPPG